MSLDPDQIARLGTLAKLKIGPESLPGLSDDLNRILALVQTLSQVDTEGVEPLAHPLELSQPLRPDTADPDIDRETLQSGAPGTEAGYYLVPRVVE